VNVATGVVEDGTHEFTYRGQLIQFEAEKEGLNIKRNGEEFSYQEIKDICLQS